MSSTLSIHEVAEAEINEAADFYDLESPGLGGVFLDEIQRAFQSIVAFPDASSTARSSVRTTSPVINWWSVRMQARK